MAATATESLHGPSAPPAVPMVPDKRIPALDGLRGLAIVSVMLYHYGDGGIQSSTSWVRHVSWFLGAGWTGVDLFFVLSGYLITGILYDTRTGPGYYKSFYIRRILRIFPIYYLTIAVMFLVGMHVGVHWAPGHLLFLFYLGYPAALLWPTLIPASPLMRLTHLWSLSVEEQFYLIWPWSIRALATKRRILTVCAIVFSAGLLLRITLVGCGRIEWASSFLFCRMDTLAVGAAIAMLVRTIDVAKVQGLATAAFLLAGAAFVAIGLHAHSFARSNSAIATWGYSLTAIAYGGLLLMSLGVVAPVFSLLILRVFGKYSYGLYLYHFPLSGILERIKPLIMARVGSFAAGSILYVAVCITINVAIAALSFHFVEAPFLQLKGRFTFTGTTDDNQRIPQ